MFALIFVQCFQAKAQSQAQFPAAAPSASIRITHYQMNVTLDPAHHGIEAQVAVTFTALGNWPTVSFELNPALGVRTVTDESGRDLNAVRDLGSVRVTPAASLPAGASATWTFDYGGVLSAGDGPARLASTQLASIGEPVSYLLYLARWFPVTGLGTDRFTASLAVHVPAGERVFASGPVGRSADGSGAPHTDANGLAVFDFDWDRAGFPGTVIAGKFLGPSVAAADSDVRVYFIDASTASRSTRNDTSSLNDKSTAGDGNAAGQRIAGIAAQQYGEFHAQFGSIAIANTQVSEARPGAPDSQLDVIELPDTALPAASAPGMALVAGGELRGANGPRLLANTIAHQWWGEEVSPATRDDAWITNGMCRFAEIEWLKKNSDNAGFADAVRNVSASALAYDTIPVSQAAQFAAHSPQFDALTYDKGAMIFRMLRWQIGDAAFASALRGMLARKDKSISAAEVETIAEAASHQDLRPFFTEWLDSTGAPTLTDNWTLYRLGEGKTGYRLVGEITEDLDLFRMPVTVRVETAAKTIDRRVEVAGPQTQYVIETAAIPKKIALDPERFLLRSDPDMQVRVHILRGQTLAAQHDDTGAIREYRAALGIDDVSSLASYRLGEIYFAEKNYQAAENSFRDALHGDGLPKWTEVWSDLELGKIFDVTGQRERAVNQYREAVATGDDTGGAVELARGYIANAYR